MLWYFDIITARQGNDCALAVHAKKEKFSLSEMFSCELKFAINILKSGLVKNTWDELKNLIVLQNKNLKGKIQLTSLRQIL